MTHSSNQVYQWHSKMLGEGTISYYSDFNIGINATITITKFNVALEKFPRIAVVDFPAVISGKTQYRKNFTIKVDMREIKALMAKVAIGVPVILEQRISFS